MSTPGITDNTQTEAEWRAYRASQGGLATQGGRTPEAAVIYDLNQNPLGALQGEANLQTPFNSVAKRPNVYIVNHSRTKTRRVCTVPVSYLSGADEALRKSKEYQKEYGNVANIYEAAKRRDMSLYEDRVEPCVLKITFDSQTFYIPPAPEDDPDNPPAEMVPDGVWDLYLGNFERMHPNPNATPEARHAAQKEHGEEMARLTLLWSRKKNPVWRVVVDGAEEKRQDNPFGFIEFVREIPAEAPRRLDKPFLTALELVE